MKKLKGEPMWTVAASRTLRTVLQTVSYTGRTPLMMEDCGILSFHYTQVWVLRQYKTLRECGDPAKLFYKPSKPRQTHLEVRGAHWPA